MCDYSVIMCDEIIEERKTVSTKSTPIETVAAKSTSTNFRFFFAILLTTIALLIAASIYYCFIKY